MSTIIKSSYKLLLLFFFLPCFSKASGPANFKNDPPLISTLTGTVTADGKPLNGATIYLPDMRRGTASDANGKYIITNIPKGVYLVEISFIGYATINQRVDLTANNVFDAQMKLSSIEAGEIVVTGVTRATSIRRAPVPMAAINKSYINEHSASGNVIAEIANLPGVSAVTTGPNISKPFIRGLGYNRVVTAED